jgi:hypothetical protein
MYSPNLGTNSEHKMGDFAVIRSNLFEEMTSESTAAKTRDSQTDGF